jgi:hypothetical protein
MRPQAIAGFFAVLAVSGCVSPKAPTTTVEQRPTQTAEPVPAQMPPVAHQQQPAPQPPSPAPAPAPSPASPPAPIQPQTPPRQSQSQPTPQLRQPPQLPPGAAPRAPAAAAAKKLPLEAPSPPSVAQSSPSPTLNLGDLEQRLRDTRAIGVFTKLSLKNQVDDLLDAFRALYRGANKRPPAELRQRYDLLLLKVLSLLQDGDPSLASAIQSSREAIWSILADPDKFAKI